jgi:hypothetical protein
MLNLDIAKLVIEQCEEERTQYEAIAKRWERAWKLLYWSEAEIEEAERTRERELIVTNTPRNIVDLGYALIGENYKILTPTYEEGTGEQDEENARARNDFLMGLWKSHRYVGQSDTYAAIRHNMLVKGRAAVQVSWIKDKTPKTLQWYRPPVLFRSLDPCNVGFMRDIVGLKAAYHRYPVKVGQLKLDYPEAADLEAVKEKDPKECVIFYDFWYLDDKGTVWNAFLLDCKEFIRKPTKSKLPIIPIIVRSANEIPDSDPRYQSLSIIDGIMNEWEQENMIESMIMTGIAKNFFPTRYATDDSGEPIPDIQEGPGVINEVSRTFRFVDAPSSRPDFQNAAIVAERIKDRIENGSFHESLYGNAGSQRSGYMFGLVLQAGMGRLGGTVRNISRLMAECNALALCMVKKFSPKGEETYLYEDKERKFRKKSLTPDQIHESYENHVQILPENNGSEELQKLAIAFQMVQAQILSRQTVRERLLPWQLPDNEMERILTEMAMTDPDVLAARIRAAYKRYYGEDLPPGEPDFTATPPPQPQSLQPPQAFPGVPLPPADQGQLTPEQVTGDANVDPMVYDAMMQQMAMGGMF